MTWIVWVILMWTACSCGTTNWRLCKGYGQSVIGCLTRYRDWVKVVSDNGDTGQRLQMIVWVPLRCVIWVICRAIWGTFVWIWGWTLDWWVLGTETYCLLARSRRHFRLGTMTLRIVLQSHWHFCLYWWWCRFTRILTTCLLDIHIARQSFQGYLICVAINDEQTILFRIFSCGSLEHRIRDTRILQMRHCDSDLIIRTHIQFTRFTSIDTSWLEIIW